MADTEAHFGGNATNGAKPNGPPRDEAAALIAKEKGWAVPKGFNKVEDVDSAQTLEPSWMHKAQKYEWSGEYGDVGPEIPALERQLFGDDSRIQKGLKFVDLTSIKVIAEATERPAPIQSFQDAGLHPVMTANVTKLGYSVPTPIQAYCVPAVLKGRDVIAIAQTGSGKTAAYMIPVLSKLLGKAKKLRGPRPDITSESYNPATDNVRAEPLVLIVAPTRELCIQIFDDARRLCYRSMLRPCVAYGGGPVREQREDLRKGCDILIATPGRLRDFMKDPRLLALSRLRFTIIDEADELLHEDWSEDLAEILSGGGANQDGQHQYLLFSATFDKRMRNLAKKYLAQDFVRIRIGRAGSAVSSIKQQIVWVDGNKKKDALYDLLIASPPARTLIFVKSKRMVDIIDDFLFNKGLPTTSIHGDRTQLEREDTMRAFRKGSAPILITTGVSSRGLDIKNVMHIINYDLPSVDYNGQHEYIHRIGRTGRLGNVGLATSFYNESDEPMAPFLAKILVENGQEVPDFLEDYKPPTDQPLDFDDDSGDEENEDQVADNNDASGGDTWGNGDSASPAAAPSAEQGWVNDGNAQSTTAVNTW